MSSHSRISNTAFIVIASLVKLSNNAQWKKVFHDKEHQALHYFCNKGATSLLRQSLVLLPPGFANWLMDIMFIPGMMYHYLYRKKFIRNRIEATINAGYSQVIVLGAGFDTLTLRLNITNPDVSCFELDLPVTQEVKRHMLQEMNITRIQDHFFIAGDLQKDVGNYLQKNPALNPHADTAIVLEGVLMYLEESEVVALFQSLSAFFKGQLRLIFGAAANPPDTGSRRRRFIHHCLKRGNESTKWHCKGEDIADFMDKLGYEVSEKVLYKDLQRPYRESREINHLPEQDENYFIADRKA